MDITKVKVWDKVLKSFYELKAIYFDNDMVGIKIGDEVDGEWTVIKKEHVEFIKPTDSTDHNCKDVYEGDILQSIYDESHVSVVEYCSEDVGSCGCCYDEFEGAGFKAKGLKFRDAIVIGNIYEHPHLLEGVK